MAAPRRRSTTSASSTVPATTDAPFTTTAETGRRHHDHDPRHRRRPPRRGLRRHDRGADVGSARNRFGSALRAARIGADGRSRSPGGLRSPDPGRRHRRNGHPRDPLRRAGGRIQQPDRGHGRGRHGPPRTRIDRCRRSRSPAPGDAGRDDAHRSLARRGDHRPGHVSGRHRSRHPRRRGDTAPPRDRCAGHRVPLDDRRLDGGPVGARIRRPPSDVRRKRMGPSRSRAT